MKNIFLFLFLSFITSSTLMAQDVLSNQPFTSQWSTIDSLLEQGLPQSAKEAIEKLQSQLEKGEEDPILQAHSIKALIYELRINAQLEEQGEWNALRQLEDLIAASENPVKAIYQSYLAEHYLQYWQRNRWKIDRRTELEAQTPTEDETSWSSKNFSNRITELFLASLQDTRSQELALMDFSPIIISDKEADQLRPSVYDLLLHRALNHFRNNEAFLGEPRDEPLLDDIAFLNPVEDFVNINLPTVEKVSSYQRLLQILQEALRWSATTRPDSEAHLDLNLIRLKIVYRQLDKEEKREAYAAALRRLVREKKNTEQEAMVLQYLLEYHEQQGVSYSEKNDYGENRWAYQKAVGVAKDIIARYPDASAAEYARKALQRIENPELLIAIEAVQLPNTPGLVSLSFKNIEKVFLKAIPITVEEYHDPEKEKEELRTILERNAALSWSENLPQSGDYRTHSVETALRGLPPGVYCLAVANRNDFSFEEGATALLYFWVSELAVIEMSDRGGEHHFMVVNRKTGVPIADATVKMWTYPRRNQRNEKMIQAGVYQTDEKGQVLVQGINRQNVRLEVITENDHLYPSESHWIYSGNSQNESQGAPYTTFFTDRGLYRPGQTVYFKTLALQRKQDVPEIVPNTKFTVTLLDANSQEVAKLSLVSNEFGSAKGQFTLPTGGLLGNMYLQSSLGNGNTEYVRVEEYKRPRFEVKLSELEAEPRLGESVTVEGTAMAYAGPAIATAAVNYTVVREVSYPWYRGYGRFYPSYGNPVTVATGTTETDENGSFTFQFTAEPDGDIEKNEFPLYQYRINAEVVDGTGETRVAEKSIRLTQYPFKLQLTLAEEQDVVDEIVLSLSCENLDGQPLDKEVQVIVNRLDAPNKTYVQRYWQRPDTFLLKEKTFREYFPLFTYFEKEEPENWPLGDALWQQSLSLKGTDSLSLNAQSWIAGHYQVTLLTITEEGDTLETSQRFKLHDWAKKKFAAGKWLYLKKAQETLQPGETASWQLGEVGPAVQSYAALQNLRENHWSRWLKQEEAIRYEVKEEDRGGLSWNNLYVINNRFYEEAIYWPVPWNNKKLDISYETFRSKLYPDAEEEWIIRIEGPDKDAVAAELLASMYDASLDQITPFDWSFSAFPTGRVRDRWRALNFRQLSQQVQFKDAASWGQQNSRTYPSFWFSQWRGLSYSRNAKFMTTQRSNVSFGIRAESAPMTYSAMSDEGQGNAEADVAQYAVPPVLKETGEANTQSESSPPTKVRTNLAETAFFFPQLATDEEGRIVLKFRAPESLTRWKLQLFGHTKELAYALDSKEVVTQKELMILPNAPRFLREGDQLTFTAKVSNLSDQELTGEAVLELFDLQTNEDSGSAYSLSTTPESFTLQPNASQTVRWSIQVPNGAVGVLGYRVIARSGDFSDGEEAALPVLTNRILLTEAQPLFVRPNSTKKFTLERLENADENTDHHAFRLDITSNPAWEAIKALPYLQEYPYDCTEQIVNRIFANSLASKVVQDYPKTREVFAEWRENKEALKSPLLQNEELKTALLEETPWVMEAKNESLQRERIALLFDLDRLANELAVAERKLLLRQSGSGAFSWFPGGPEQWYMTQYVVEQLSHLRQLTGAEMSYKLKTALEKAVRYCDEQAYKWYEDLSEEERTAKQSTTSPGPRIAHYLYTRSLNLEVDIKPEHAEMYEYCWKIATDNWLETSLFQQTLIGLAAKHSNRTELAQRIYASLQERSLHSEALGRYWKGNSGYYWYQNEVETHVKITELYDLMGADAASLAELKIWLLRNKETNRWETTKATAAAIFALVSTGDNWLGETTPLEIEFPEWSKSDYSPKVAQGQATAEAGTGAYQVRWSADEVQPEMATIRLRNRSKAPGWGALYWQYFTTIDQVSRDGDNPLRIERQLYRRVNNGEGEVLQKLKEAPQPGERITVRLVVRNDRALEFVHLKDLRASGLEPIDQLSSYRYQGGLGYYQQTTDLGTHFFFHNLPAGEYVLEYDLRVFHEGDFSGGLSTIQCMYAPKFTSHSEGVRLRVE